MIYIVNTGNFLSEHTARLGHTLAFGSSEMRIPSFSQWLKSSTLYSDKVLLDKIKNWPYLHNAAAFDEWVANGDRHFGNILFAGQDDFYLIDHGHCFTGPGWSRKKLDPEVKISNKLLDTVKKIGRDESNKRLSEISFVNEWSGVDIQDLGLKTNAKEYEAQNLIENVVAFIQMRFTGLETRLRRELGGYLYEWDSIKYLSCLTRLLCELGSGSYGTDNGLR